MRLRRSHAIAIALIVAGGSLGAVAIGAVGEGTASVLVPIAPCRLVDTRASSQVGPRFLPIGPGQTVTFQVTGTNGDCTLPAGATAIASNVTTVNSNASSYLTVFPADATKPTASNLNWNAGAPPTPNQVTVGLSATGAIKVFNLAGSIDVIIDVVGYYRTEGASGSPGPTGPTGATGSTGATGARGLVGTRCAATDSWYDASCRPNAVTVGDLPTDIAVTSNRIWITNAGSGTVTKINPNTNATIATVTVGTDPGPIAYDGTAIWVANRGGGTISRVDASANTVVATIPVGGTPSGITTDGTGVWVTVTDTDTAVRIDPATNTVTATAPTPDAPSAIAFDGAHLWIGAASAVRVIDPSSLAVVEDLTVGGTVRALQSDGRSMWLGTAGATSVTPYDLATFAAGSAVSLSGTVRAIAFDGDDLWATTVNETDGAEAVWRIDPRSGTSRDAGGLTVGDDPIGVAYDGASVWVAAAGSDRILRFVP